MYAKIVKDTYKFLKVDKGECRLFSGHGVYQTIISTRNRLQQMTTKYWKKTKDFKRQRSVKRQQ